MHSRRYSYFSTPLTTYLGVMLPICALELFLIISRSPPWMEWSAGVVVLLSIYGAAIGYWRRLVLQPDAAIFRRPLSSVVLEWSKIRRVGVYQPGGGVGQTQYVYLTVHDRPPDGKWEQDSSVIQIQNRPGLIEAIERFRGLHLAGGDQG